MSSSGTEIVTVWAVPQFEVVNVSEVLSSHWSAGFGGLVVLIVTVTGVTGCSRSRIV